MVNLLVQNSLNGPLRKNRLLYVFSIILISTFTIFHYFASESSMFEFLTEDNPTNSMLSLIFTLSCIISIAHLVQTEFVENFVTKEQIRIYLKTKLFHLQSKYPIIFMLITKTIFYLLAVYRMTSIPVFVFIAINLALSGFFLGQSFYKYRPFHYVASSDNNLQYITKSDGSYVFSLCVEGKFTGTIVFKDINKEDLIVTNDNC